MTAEFYRQTKSAHTPSFLGGVCALFVGVTFLLIPGLTHAEYIESFTADIVVQKDATLQVTEKITYVFTEEKHGIFRCIPTLHQEKASSFYKERYIDIVVTTVQMDAGTVPYSLNDKNGEQCITIGDPASTISGTHTYHISYTVGGAISYPAFGGAELYWNVTGNAWEVPMKRAIATVSSPDGLLIRERACSRGEVGKTDSCSNVSESDGVVHFNGGALAPREGVTIAQALNRSIIPHDVRERFNMRWILGALGIIVAIGLGVWVYVYKTQFKTGNTIIPQYEPYPGVKPMYAGLLFDKRLDPRDITAGIMYLAEQGFLTIKKVDRKVLFLFEVDDYELTLLRPLSDITDRFERSIVTLIFNEEAGAGKQITLHELKTNYGEAKKNARVLQKLQADLVKDLEEQGYFVKFTFTSFFTTKFVVAFVLIGVALSRISSEALIVGVVLLSIVFLLLSQGRRTRKGYEALDHLKGFKDFLRVTESQRYIFHNAPAKNAEQFMEFLPYAIAFGVEKEWAKTFEGITIPNPGWYSGGTGAHTFSAVALTQSLGGFSSTFATASGTGASSGGGFSGGGSGGGGGGSW